MLFTNPNVRFLADEAANANAAQDFILQQNSEAGSNVYQLVPNQNEDAGIIGDLANNVADRASEFFGIKEGGIVSEAINAGADAMAKVPGKIYDGAGAIAGGLGLPTLSPDKDHLILDKVGDIVDNGKENISDIIKQGDVLDTGADFINNLADITGGDAINQGASIINTLINFAGQAGNAAGQFGEAVVYGAGEGGEEIPVGDLAGEEIPIVNTPDEEIPIVNTPDEEIPVVNTPDEEIPVVNTPDEEIPIVNTPEEEIPVEDIAGESEGVVHGGGGVGEEVVDDISEVVDDITEPTLVPQTQPTTQATLATQTLATLATQTLATQTLATLATQTLATSATQTLATSATQTEATLAPQTEATLAPQTEATEEGGPAVTEESHMIPANLFTHPKQVDTDASELVELDPSYEENIVEDNVTIAWTYDGHEEDAKFLSTVMKSGASNMVPVYALWATIYLFLL